MANTLFTEEDFIKKNPPQKRNKNSFWYWLILLAIIVITILGIGKCSKQNHILEEPVILTTVENAVPVIADTLVVNTTEEKQNAEIKWSDISNKDGIENTSNLNVEQMALAVIRGNYDNNPIRRQKLGEDYQVIQDKVNEFYRKGLVH